LVSLLEPDQLADDDAVAVVSAMVEPLLVQERLADKTPLEQAVALMCPYISRRDSDAPSVVFSGVKDLAAFLDACRPGLRVRDAALRTSEGFLRGRATLDGLDEDRGHTFALAFQNEFAVGWLDGEPRVMTSDLICVMDTLSGEAIGTETLRYGQRVSVVALPAPPVLLTPKGLEHVGPRAFGYDLEFTSVFAW